MDSVLTKIRSVIDLRDTYHNPDSLKEDLSYVFIGVIFWSCCTFIGKNVPLGPYNIYGR